MKTVHLDLRDISSPEVLHSLLARRLSLPDYYGKNLDALNDVLGEIGEPTHIVVLSEADGAAKCVKGALRVLSAAAAGNPELSVNFFEL